MARPAVVPAPSLSEEERVYVASQWKLIWMRFRRHRLALFSVAVLALFYFVVLFPEFLAIHDPLKVDSKRVFVGPQKVHFLDGYRPTRPYVEGLKVTRDMVTMRLEYELDETVRHPIHFFVRGHEYDHWKLFKTDRHLMGVKTAEGMQNFHPLGTDRLGRDMWSRIAYGTRISMSIGLVGVAISLILGVMLGGISGYFGGLIDVLIQRLVEFIRSIPTIPLWLALAAAVPPDWSILRVYFAITIIISFIGWTRLAREVRGRFLALREEDFVVAAQLYGTGPMRIIIRHMVPSFTSHIIATTTLAIPAIIIAETALSFLGLGMRQPAISWGVLLKEGQNIQSVALAPWVLFPGVLVVVAILAYNFLGDGLRDAADPYAVKG